MGSERLERVPLVLHHKGTMDRPDVQGTWACNPTAIRMGQVRSGDRSKRENRCAMHEEFKMETSILREHDEWLTDHLEELMRQYASKVVAVHEGRLVHTGDSEVEVYEWVRKRGLTPMPLVFRVPREEDLHAIL